MSIHNIGNTLNFIFCIKLSSTLDVIEFLESSEIFFLIIFHGQFHSPMELYVEKINFNNDLLLIRLPKKIQIYDSLLFAGRILSPAKSIAT